MIKQRTRTVRRLGDHRRPLASTLQIAAPPLIVLGFMILQTLVVTIGCLALISGTTLLAAGRLPVR